MPSFFSYKQPKMIGEAIKESKGLKYFEKIFWKDETYTVGDAIMLLSDEDCPWIAISKCLVSLHCFQSIIIQNISRGNIFQPESKRYS